MPSRSPKSLFHISSLSVGFLGIQLGFALQAGNVSRILQIYGADLADLPLFWLAAPLTGMFVQPLIGYYSDRTWTSLGRRKPYLLAGGLLAAIALFLLPNAVYFLTLFSPLLFGALFIVLVDMSFNISMHPLRAIISENLSAAQQGLGFAIQTCLIGLGAVIGSILPQVLASYASLSSTASKGIVPDNVRWSFYLGAVLILACLLWTSFSLREVKPPIARRSAKGKDVVSAILNSIKTLPGPIWQIGVVQFFSWFALFTMWVYSTPAIAQHYYKIAPTDIYSAQYAEAGNLTGVLFGTYSMVACLAALLLPKCYRWIGQASTHGAALLLGALGFFSMYFFEDSRYLYFSMTLIGLAWASILATPYALLSNYMPPQKIGIYLGLFNFFITLPQLINGFVGGWLMQHIFHDQAIKALLFAGFMLFLGGIMALFLNKKFLKAGRSAHHEARL